MVKQDPVFRKFAMAIKNTAECSLFDVPLPAAPEFA
jgi:hypothetical protein